MRGLLEKGDFYHQRHLALGRMQKWWLNVLNFSLGSWRWKLDLEHTEKDHAFRRYHEVRGPDFNPPGHWNLSEIPREVYGSCLETCLNNNFLHIYRRYLNINLIYLDKHYNASFDVLWEVSGLNSWEALIWTLRLNPSSVCSKSLTCHGNHENQTKRTKKMKVISKWLFRTKIIRV